MTNLTTCGNSTGRTGPGCRAARPSSDRRLRHSNVDAPGKSGGAGGAVSWIDPNGNLWLFGGKATIRRELGYLNDLWRYVP